MFLQSINSMPSFPRKVQGWKTTALVFVVWWVDIIISSLFIFYFYFFSCVFRWSDVHCRKAQRSKSKERLSGGELGDGLGALGDGVLGELTGKDEADRGLDFPGGKGRLTVVLGELSGLSGNALEGVVDEGVHDGHSLRSESAIEGAKRTDLD